MEEEEAYNEGAEEFEQEFDMEEEWTSESEEKGADSEVRRARTVEQTGEEESEEDLVLPFQVLTSHVCSNWREVALKTPSLWTTLTFTEGSPFEKSRTWIERSRGLPLDLFIDCTIPEDEASSVNSDQESGVNEDRPIVREETHGRGYLREHSGCDHPPPPLSLPDLSVILDIVIPHVDQWRQLEVTCSVFDYMHLLLTRLEQCPAAPRLEILQLYHYSNCEDYEVFNPPELSTKFFIFNGEAPALRDVSLWGVHLDWDRSLSLLSGLQDFELAYHAKNVRPSWATFAQILYSSPDLRTLTLCLSGPADDGENVPWDSEALSVPSLKELVLCYHEVKYAIALVRKLSVPNVYTLTLDYDEEDCTEFVRCLTSPMRGSSRSLLAGLEHLKIAGLPCADKAIDLVFEQLVGLKTLNLNCSREDEEKYFDRLLKSSSGSAGLKIYCPNLETITTSGIEGFQMKAFVAARKAAGFPIKRVLMSEEDDVDAQQEDWIRKNVEEFNFFEPSDSEEYVDEDEEDMEDEFSDSMEAEVVPMDID